MMRHIKVLRSTIGHGILEPVKCSENMQLAINSYNHLTIVEPKLPLFHQCIEPCSEGTTPTLDSAALFDVRSVFHLENLDSLGLQIFSRLLIENGEKMFNFGRVSEPIIVGHAWSPIDPCTRDCYLGILLNAGEVLILRRDSLDANSYSVKFRSFAAILDKMSLPHNRLTAEGDIIMTRDQYLELRVTDFLFGKTPEGSLIVTFAHESGDITIHTLSENLPLLQRFIGGGLVTMMLWSARCTELFYVLLDNSVWGCKFGPNMSILEGGPVNLKDPSRFLVSHLQYLPASQHVVVTDTRALHVGSMTSPWVSANLPYNSLLVNVSLVETLSDIAIILPYESGRLCVAKIHTSSNSISITEEFGGWNSFHNQALHKYEVLLLKEQSKALSKAFQPYLAENCEGQITIHGFVPMVSNGLAAVVYSLTPKNTITHTIKSRKEFTLGLIPLESIIEAQIATAPSDTSTLSYLSGLLVKDKDMIPEITKDMKDGNEAALQRFVEKLREWKLSKFCDPSLVELSITPTSSLLESIVRNFRDSHQIHDLQNHLLLNISLTRTLRAIKSKNEKPCDALNDELVTIAREQDTIFSKIRIQLASIVMSWASEQSISSFESTLDTFLLNTYLVVLMHSNMELAVLPIPERVKLIISTDICTEVFEISRKEDISSQFLKTIMSSSKHSWPRCDMTLLPILDLSNKMDELENCSYLAAKRDESYILRTIFSCLNYCIFTGTRTFDLKIGV